MTQQATALSASEARPSLLVRHRGLLAAAGGGIVSALALPPTDLYPCMFVGLALLAFALRDAERVRSGLFAGWLWGTFGQLVGMRFVPSVIQLFTDLGTAAALTAHVLLSAAQSLTWAIGMALAVLVHRRLRAPLELAFGAGMLVTVSLPSVFVWTPAGLLSPWPVLVQSAELVGERGTSVLFAILAALLVRGALALRTRRAVAPLAAAGSLLCAMLAHGLWAMHSFPETTSDAGRTARIGLIHAGIDPRFRWERGNWPAILAELRKQTELAEAGGVELSIWPEAAYPFPLAHDARRAPRGAASPLAGPVRGPILFGLISTAKAERTADGWRRDSYNSATLVTPDGRMQPSYDKMELLWFGETVPLSDQIPWLKRTFQRSGGLVPGAELRGLTLVRRGEPLRMAVLNCYEDTLPALGRTMMRELEPNLLVNVTNDAWFMGTVEPELHMRLSAMRAIEARRDLVRAVNLGVAGWIDAAGRVRARSDAAEPGWLLATPTLREGPRTLYTRLGDAPSWGLLALGVGVFGWRARRREQPKRSTRSEG